MKNGKCYLLDKIKEIYKFVKMILRASDVANLFITLSSPLKKKIFTGKITKSNLLWRGQFQGLLFLLASDSDDKLPAQIIRLMP